MNFFNLTIVTIRKDPSQIPVKVFRYNPSIYINEHTLDSLEKSCRTKLVLPDSVMKADNLKLLK